MLRKLLIAAFLALLVGAVAASAASGSGRRAKGSSVTSTVLMPGVTYTREVDFTPSGPVVLDVVTAPKPNGTTYTLAPILSTNTVRGREKLTSMEQRLDAGATTVGIDGDYFDHRSGAPAGIFLSGGVLASPPTPDRSSLGIGAGGGLEVARVGFAGTWQGSSGLRPLVLNPGTPTGHFDLYTSAYGATTPSEHHAVEAVIEPFPPAAPGQPLDGTVTAVVHHGPTAIPADGAVLVGRGTYAPQVLAEDKVGQQVEVRLSLSPDWSSLAGAIGGGPLLVSGGKAVYPVGEAFAPGLLNTPQARGAVGQLADGRIVLVTVEGATPAYSLGISTYDLALELVHLGAVTAIGLGSGQPAGMAFDGSLLTRPSGGREVPIADALVLSYTGVYAAPPAEAVLSPNGDGVADTQTLSYRLARPSQVLARLAGPDGATLTLADDAETPGLHQFVWDGTIAGAPAPEGTWTFVVRATDDRRITTVAQRFFSLDDTLSSLAVRRAGKRRLTATFELTRAASVVVRVERPNGIPVATLRSGALAPGSQSAQWQGKIGRRNAPPGRYQLDVRAVSSVGTSSLVAPFILG